MFRNLKKKIAAIMSLGLVLSSGAVLSAAAEDTGSITITAPDGISDLTGLKANAYQVLQEGAQETDGDAVYTVTNNFEEFFATAKTSYTNEPTKPRTFYLTLNGAGNLSLVTTEPGKGTAHIRIELKDTETLDVTYFEASLLSHITGDPTSQEGTEPLSADMETLSNWLTSYVKKKNITTSYKTTVNQGTNPVTSTTITDVPDGYYLIACDVPQGIAVERSLVQVVDGEDVSVELKADTQYVTKLVKNGVGETFAESTSANMSDTLTYQITMPVTKVTDATRVTSAVLKDTIQHHSFSKSTFTMKVVEDNETNNGTIDVATYTYSYIASPESASFTKTQGTEKIANVTFGTEESTKYPTFTITFTEAGIADLNALASENNIKIVVTYHAVLGSDAVNENMNTAKWTLGKGPYTYEGSDETLVYTYGIDIDKTFSDNQTATNAGSVQFEIYAGSVNDDTKLKVVKDSNGNYHVDNTPTAQDEVKLTPDTEGNLVLTGLKEGTYILKEVDTADDFQLAGDVTIILTADDTTKSDLSNSSTAMIGGKPIVNERSITEESDTHISMLSMTILNQKGFNLPSTGGAGTWMFAIGGILLFAGAAAVLVAVSRKEDA